MHDIKHHQIKTEYFKRKITKKKKNLRKSASNEKYFYHLEKNFLQRDTIFNH